MITQVSAPFALALIGLSPFAFAQTFAPAAGPAVGAAPAPVATVTTGAAVPVAPPAPTASAPPVKAATQSRATVSPPPPPPPPAAAALNPGTVSTPIDASPRTLAFPDRWNGDAPLFKFFTIDRVPRGGPVSVALGGSGTFRIAELRVYGPPSKGAVSASVAPAIGGARAGASAMRARPAMSSAAPPVPVAKTPYDNYVLKTSMTSAPFSFRAEEGDLVFVNVEFAPKFSFEEGAGPKTARVDVNATFWKSSVALNGFFNGLKLGLAFGRPPTAYAADQPYVPGTRFSAYSASPELSVVNASGQPQLVQLSADQLPPGVQVAPQQVQFATGESRGIPLAVTWDPRNDPTGDARLRLTYGGKTSYGTMRIEHVPFGRSFRASGGGWSAQVTVRSSGEVRYDTQCFISGMQLVHDCTYYFYRNGVQETDTVARATSVGGSANDVRSWTNHSGLKPDETFDYLQSTWTLVEFDSSTGDPNEHARIPLTAQP